MVTTENSSGERGESLTLKHSAKAIVTNVICTVPWTYILSPILVLGMNTKSQDKDCCIRENLEIQLKYGIEESRKVRSSGENRSTKGGAKSPTYTERDS